MMRQRCTRSHFSPTPLRTPGGRRGAARGASARRGWTPPACPWCSSPWAGWASNGDPQRPLLTALALVLVLVLVLALITVWGLGQGQGQGPGQGQGQGQGR